MPSEGLEVLIQLIGYERCDDHEDNKQRESPTTAEKSPQDTQSSRLCLSKPHPCQVC